MFLCATLLVPYITTNAVSLNENMFENHSEVKGDTTSETGNTELNQVVPEAATTEVSHEQSPTKESTNPETEQSSVVRSTSEDKKEANKTKETDVSTQESSEKTSDTEDDSLVKATIPPENPSDIVANAPKGLRTTDLFAIPKASHDGNENHAVVSTNEATNTDVVFITQGINGTSQLGGLWSQKNYKLNIKKDFKIGMKLYFGNKGSEATDGMAFTIHNPGTKEGAINEQGNAVVIGNAGGSLGVMGRGTEKKDKPWEMAVQNAFTIEFDSHVNYDGLDMDMDRTKDAFHIANYYPAMKDQYRNNNSNNSLKGIIHQDPIGFSKANHQSDGQWHDFQVVYNAETHGLSYTYDGQTINTTLDVGKLNPSTAENGEMMYWGFTGATGKSPTTNAVVFTELPNLGTLDTHQDVLDQKGESVHETTDKVFSGDKLTYNYDVGFDKGVQGTEKLTMNASLDELASLADGTKGVKVSYKKYDGSTVEGTQGDGANDFQVTEAKGALILKNLHELGPEQGTKEYYKSLHVEVPLVADKSGILTEPKVIQDNFSITDRKQFTVKSSTDKEKQSSVLYTINPVKVKLAPDKVSDLNRELKENETSKAPLKTEALSGKIDVTGSLDLASLTIRVTSPDGGLLTKEGEPATIESTPEMIDVASKTFKMPLGNHSLVANKKLTYEVLDSSEEVLVSEELAIQDGTPPTGELKEVYYTLINQLPEASKLLSAYQDSNPAVNPADIKVTYNGKEVETIKELWGTQGKDESHKKPMLVNLKLADPAGNTLTLDRQMLEVLAEQLWMEGPDELTLTSKEMLQKAPEKPEIMPNRQIISPETLREHLKSHGLKGYYLDRDEQTLRDITDEIKLEGLEAEHYLPGTYPLKGTLTYGKETLPPKDIQLTVQDGELNLNVKGELSYKGKLNNLLNQYYKSESSAILNVTDQRYAQDGWQVKVQASPFIESGTSLELPMSKMTLQGKTGETYHDLQGDSGYYLLNGEMKSLVGNDLAQNGNPFTIELLTPSASNWAKTKDNYETQVNWELSPTNSDVFSGMTFGQPEKKG